MTPKPLVLAVLVALAQMRGKQGGSIWIHPRDGLVVV